MAARMRAMPVDNRHRGIMDAHQICNAKVKLTEYGPWLHGLVINEKYVVILEADGKPSVPLSVWTHVSRPWAGLAIMPLVLSEKWGVTHVD